MLSNVTAMYFSPTGTTKKVVEGLAEQWPHYHSIDFTSPVMRTSALSFNADDTVIIGVPVYAGRVPNILLKFLNGITGNGAAAIPVVVYGNRHYDDALIELCDILEQNGFKIIAAGAFIGEHSFSKSLAAGRPDEKDMACITAFGKQIYWKIAEGDPFKAVLVSGNTHYRSYYQPLDESNLPVDLRKVKPKTSVQCTRCNACAHWCPVGSIDAKDPAQLNSFCIKCGACVKKCPVHAKYFDDLAYLRHKQELEKEFVERKDPTLFIGP